MTKDQAMIHTLMKENDELKLEIGRLREMLSRHKWIPVTEDLPKERKAYLISIIKTDSGFQLVPRVAEYVGIVPGAIANYIGKGKNKWKILDDGGLASSDYRDLLECVAWRELPEPYKEEGE